MGRLKFDIIMKVHLCEKHKAVFSERVRVALSEKTFRCEVTKAIRPGELTKLIRKAERCLDCKWETTFGK